MAEVEAEFDDAFPTEKAGGQTFAPVKDDLFFQSPAQTATFRWNSHPAILFYVTIGLFVLFCIWPGTNGPADLTEIAAFAFWAATTSMTTCIMALYRGWLRLLLGSIGLLLAAVFIMVKLNGMQGEELVLLSIGLAAPILLTLETLKFFAGKFERGSAVRESNEALQFGILHLLGATTVVAVICSLGRWLIPIVLPILDNDILKLAMGLQVIAISTLLGVWAFLGKCTMTRISVWFLISATLIWFVSFYLMVAFAVIWVLILSTASIAVGVMLILLRVDGVRFVKRKLQCR